MIEIYINNDPFHWLIIASPDLKGKNCLFFEILNHNFCNAAWKSEVIF